MVAEEVARLLSLVARHIGTQCGDDCEVVGLAELAAIAEQAKRLAATQYPTKDVGSLNRGQRLTRAGLLHRYHAFLIGELRTLSLSFYGSRDYALKMMPIDSAVKIRTSELFEHGKPKEYRRGQKTYPFFDESKLANRARSVLKSLKIDIVKAEPR